MMTPKHHLGVATVITEQEFTILERLYGTDLYMPYWNRLLLKYLKIHEWLEEEP